MSAQQPAEATPKVLPSSARKMRDAPRVTMPYARRRRVSDASTHQSGPPIAQTVPPLSSA